MRHFHACAVGALLVTGTAHAAQPPLLTPAAGAAIAEELSGEAAKRAVETFSLHHRMRGSRGFHAAGEYVAAQLKSYGLSSVEIVEIPADGTTFYGTQKSRRAWDADFAELWEMAKDGEAFQRMSLRLAVKVAFWCSTVKAGSSRSQISSMRLNIALRLAMSVSISMASESFGMMTFVIMRRRPS